MEHEDKPFFRSDSEQPRDGSHPDPLTASLLKAADPGNACRSGLCCSIRLWSEWAQMVDTLDTLGEVLITTRNAGAILGERRMYPGMRFADGLHCAHSPDGSLALEFTPWNSAYIACHTHENGSMHAIEFHDESGTVPHKICITGNSRRDRLVEWMELHQGIPGEVPAQTPFAVSRWHTVPQRHWLDYDETETLSDYALEDILRRAVERRFPIRVTVGNESVTQSCDMIPRNISARHPWVFVSTDDVGLHFDPARFGEHVLHRTPPSADSPSAVTIKSFTEDGCLGLELAAPSELPASEWADFLAQSIINP